MGYVHITNSKQRKHLSPSARCAPVNGLAGCYVSTIGKPHEYFDLTGSPEPIRSYNGPEITAAAVLPP